jgi:hypothetical protein
MRVCVRAHHVTFCAIPIAQTLATTKQYRITSDIPLQRHRPANNIIRHPRPLLLFSRFMQRLRPLTRLHIQIGNIALPISQLDSNFKLLVQHHIVFPQSSLAIIHTQDALLHLHLVGRAAPGYGIVLALLAPGAGDCDTAFGEGETGAGSGFGDAGG